MIICRCQQLSRIGCPCSHASYRNFFVRTQGGCLTSQLRCRFLRLSQRVSWKRCMLLPSQMYLLLMYIHYLKQMDLCLHSPVRSTWNCTAPALVVLHKTAHTAECRKFAANSWHLVCLQLGMACRLPSSKHSWMLLGSYGRVVPLLASLSPSSPALLPLEEDRRPQSFQVCARHALPIL